MCNNCYKNPEVSAIYLHQNRIGFTINIKPKVADTDNTSYGKDPGDRLKPN